MKTVKYINDKDNGLCLYSIIDYIVDYYTKKYKIDSSRVSREDIVQDNVVIYLETLNKTREERYERFNKYYKKLSERLEFSVEVSLDDIDIPVDNVYTTIMIGDFYDGLKEVFKTLPFRNEFIIKKYYGVGCEKCYNMVEISRQLNLTPERIRQLKAISLRRMRMSFRAKRIKDYLEFFNE